MTLESEILKGFSEQSQQVFQKWQNIRLCRCRGVAIRWGCKVMKIAANSFYHKLKSDTEKALKDADLRDKIEAICLEFPRYGYRQVTVALQQQSLR